MEVVVTTGAKRRAKLQSYRHHQQNNTQCLTGRMPFLSPNQQCRRFTTTNTITSSTTTATITSGFSFNRSISLEITPD